MLKLVLLLQHYGTIDRNVRNERMSYVICVSYEGLELWVFQASGIFSAYDKTWSHRLWKNMKSCEKQVCELLRTTTKWCDLSNTQIVGDKFRAFEEHPGESLVYPKFR